MWNKLKQWLHPDHITRSSIKEGFDDLPAAVCYFTPDGIIRLCNRQMFRVYRALSGRDLQSLEELHQQVLAPTHGRRVDGKNPSFVLPDGTCWLYSEQTVLGEGGCPHVECIFSEVTDLQRQRQELLQQNQELLRMNRELRRLSENVQEMTREKEIMAFKTRLHDKMGYGLTAVRQCLLQQKDPAELEASLEQMNKAVQLYRKDSEAPPEENEWDVFVEDAAQLGVTVALQGPMPRQHQQLLLTIARECITNAKPARETDPPAKGGFFYAHFAPKSAKLWNTPEILEKLWAEHRKIFTVLSLMAHAEPRGGVVSLIQ